MRSRLWIFPTIDQDRQRGLSQALTISPVTASVLLARGITSQAEASRWLGAESVSLHDPFLLPDMEAVIDRLEQARMAGELVCFYGDYDVDGMSATSLYVTFFAACGLRTCLYIPHRIQEGYGLNEAAVRRLHAQGVTVLVTSDCGTTSHREIAAANELGMDVIVTDHHRTDQAMPPALGVVNPHRRDASYPFPALCSGALAYKVSQAYSMKYGGAPEVLAQQDDLVALSTVSDVVPLVDENRLFVRRGLALINKGTRPGIRALKEVAGLTRPCNTGVLAFKLVPRLNASGRLDHARLGVELLTTPSQEQARSLAERLDALNRERQQIEEGVVGELTAELAAAAELSAIVEWSRQWHLGVVGIAAARLVERYHRPAVVLTVNDQGIGKGSVRSVPGFDAYEALAACRDLLDGFGGHPGAAGLTIREERLPAFRERFQALAGGHEAVRQVPTLRLDAEVQLADVTLKLIRELDALNPFGEGNPEPLLAVRNLKVLDARVVGDNHLKLTVRQGQSFPFSSIGFRMGSLAERGIPAHQPVDLAFVPEVNRWGGLEQVQLRIRDLRPTPAS
ncbi:Single-stranded-DNA-specific exonuclease recJ [Nitrospira tepida]|uniref:Single-stranded-DNA-specific exonuclease RecJ n=1 Tax=Nitrospira tepida TaxID=2973512 RepID=A0AA86N1E5_9BACT|nr:single-stranded-DNA-specific exonuclease RecJ [Nitrospira tepida]CAI4032879.1 Single-stranded-DNA-specific exonuclease recJ [Nitrospira tepida]